MSAEERTSRVVSIRVRDERRVLALTFDDGAEWSITAELLRVESPSAEVQNHGGPRVLVAGRRNVEIRDVEPVGHYAIRIRFDDGHDTGIYSWSYLRWLGNEQERLWTRYLHDMDEAGLSRDP